MKKYQGLYLLTVYLMCALIAGLSFFYYVKDDQSRLADKIILSISMSVTLGSVLFIMFLTTIRK